MTNASTASTENNLPEVDLDRVVAAMGTFDIELTKVEGEIDAATANLVLQGRCRTLPRRQPDQLCSIRRASSYF